MLSGTVFDFKEFAVYDGPGVRQTVFMKGCPLRCRWCHNPEGLEVYPQLTVSRATCTGCGKCNEICRHKKSDGSGCTACGECIAVCPNGLRKICGETFTSQQLARRILKDAGYYESLGGGVTFSGGEPLLQCDFIVETIGLLQNVHTAIETCGFSDAENFSRLISAVDFIIMDLKIINSALHKKYTGVSNELILSNLELLKSSGKPFIIRIPLIPGVNDTEENFRSTAKLLSGCNTLKKIQLLPYHKTAGAKYSWVGRKFDPGFDENRKINIPQNVFEQYGIRWEIL